MTKKQNVVLIMLKGTLIFVAIAILFYFVVSFSNNVASNIGTAKLGCVNGVADTNFGIISCTNQLVTIGGYAEILISIFSVAIILIGIVLLLVVIFVLGGGK